ncbi:MAG: LPS export ABC transporter protein LptC [Flavobacteriales bacterium]
MSSKQHKVVSIPVIFLVTGFFFSCQNEIKEIEALTEASKLPAQTSIDAVFNYTENGMIKNRLEAGQMDRYTGEDPYIHVLNGFTMYIYDSLEQVQAEIRANEGVFDEENKRMVAQYDVVLNNNEGDTLFTEELTWLQDSGKVFTNKFVSIHSRQGQLDGQGLTSNETFTSYRLLKPVGDIIVEQPKDTLDVK